MVLEGKGTIGMEVGQRGNWTGQVEFFPLNGHAATFCPIELDYEPSPWYTGGGDSALVDGRLGSSDFRDGAWQAAQGQDMVASVDLGRVDSIVGLETGVYLYQDAWIFQPKAVVWEGSLDGLVWFQMAKSEPSSVLERDDRQERIELRPDVLEPDAKARFVRMTVENGGVCPNWHAASGLESWLFLDEMVVRTRSAQF